MSQSLIKLTDLTQFKVKMLYLYNGSGEKERFRGQGDFLETHQTSINSSQTLNSGFYDPGHVIRLVNQ